MAKTGQLFFVGIPDTAIDQQTRCWLKELQPGGIILFARNIEGWEQLESLCAELHGLDPHVWIGIDQEGGRVDRLRKLTGKTPGIGALAGRADAALLSKFGDCLGELLASLGIDIDFAPVLDIEHAVEADNGLAERCFGRSADEVVQNATAFLDGFQAWGVRVSGKHFPGLGAATLDSHFQLPSIDKSLGQLWYQDIACFQRLQHRLDSLMVSHALYLGLDENHPASVSPVVVRYLIFHKLRYRGLVLTDDLEMGAVNCWGSPLEIAQAALSAGVHFLVYSQNETSALPVWKEIVDAVAQNPTWQAQLDVRIARILAAKNATRAPLAPNRRRALEKLQRIQEKLERGLPTEE